MKKNFAILKKSASENVQSLRETFKEDYINILNNLPMNEIKEDKYLSLLNNHLEKYVKDNKTKEVLLKHKNNFYKSGLVNRKKII